MYNIAQLGQVFTPPSIVAEMLLLRKNMGRVLEPSSGNGAFVKNIPSAVGIELDATHSGGHSINIDFFDYPLSEKFETIIGNPPYVRFQDILPETKKKLPTTLFDERTNLYLFFIEKCIRHLTDNGELIFITPRDFLKASSSIKLNEFIYSQGTITDLIDLGDKKVFQGFQPNCIIFRFEKNNFSRKTNIVQNFFCHNGQLLFTTNQYEIPFKDIFSVKVGAVSGLDRVFENEVWGNEEFVSSYTAKTGRTKRMIFNTKIPYLEAHKQELIARKIKKFDEDNWWEWGRLHTITDKKRIYVNAKTRLEKPFFTHQCKNYDGAVFAIFPKNQAIEEQEWCEKLNAVDWKELGFVCDGRYLFSQKSLENTFLPRSFEGYHQK